MTVMTAGSYRFCRALARRSGSTFTFTYHLLPRRQRRAMYALYAFMRVTDDIADGDGLDKRTELDRWRNQLDDAIRGIDSHPLHPALRHAVRTYGVPPRHLHDVIDGVEADLAPVAFETFAELYEYCYRVASAVGLCCIHIWGFRGKRAIEHAESAGVAFQLTNILRDLGEDLDRGRVYLPRGELTVSPHAWRSEVHTEAFRTMMRFQADRAARFYDASEPLGEMLSPQGAAIFRVMTSAYRGLLDAIEARDFDVFSSRVRLSRWKKLSLLLGALPVRCGVWPR